MNTIKIAIAGIGNCASSLVQGIFLGKQVPDNIKGLLHQKIGGYSVSDIEIVTAFDIDSRKVGKDLSEAIFSHPNNTLVFNKNIPKINVRVDRSPTLDGFSEHMLEYPEEIRFIESPEPAVDVTAILAKTKPDILINYLPVGSQKASEYFANCCLEAGVSFINCIPVFICSTSEYASKFKEQNLVCAGDDVKSQVGATIIHRTLTNLFEKRGVKLNRTYQLNTGGNTDFLNMLERKRLKSKKISKTEAVQSQLETPLDQKDIHVGPSDFVPWQKDNKLCFIRMEGELFGGAPITLDLKLSVEDSPNSAGVIIDVIRCVKLALDRKEFGYLESVSAFAFKHPAKQFSDDKTFRLIEQFINPNE